METVNIINYKYHLFYFHRMREKIEDLKENINLFWQRSALGQKIALASLISFAILTPIISLGILSRTNLRSRAFFPVTPPVTPPSLSLFGKAIKINNSNSFVNVAPSLTTLLQTNFTVEAWVKITNNQYMNDTNPHYILAKEAANGEAPGYALSITNRKPEFRIFLIRDGQKPVNLIVTGKAVLNFDQWYHIAGVKMSNTLYLLVDGKLESTAGIDQGGHGYERSGRNLTFGCAKIINFPACIGNFYGEIDEVRLSRTARIPKNPLPPQTPFVVDEFTQALWHFDGDVNDVSGNNNHGKIFGKVEFVDSDINPAQMTPSPPLPSPSPSFQKKTVTINPLQDACNYEMWPNTPYQFCLAASNSLSEAKSKGYGYLLFKLKDTVPPNSQILDAYLSLTASAGYFKDGTSIIETYETSLFDEKTLTWNNQPKIGRFLAKIEDRLYVDSAYQWNVGEIVKNYFISKKDYLAVLVKINDSKNGSIQFHDKDTFYPNKKPYLIIWYQTPLISPPPPSPSPSPTPSYSVVYNLTLNYSPDWQTNEFYQYNLSYELNTKGVSKNLYPIKITLNQTNLTSLPNILYAQTTLPIDGKLKTFEFKKIGIDYYQTNWFNVNSQNCFDLYSNKSYLPNSYLGTGCFKIYYLIDKGQKRIYSLNSRVYVDFSYSGDPILILTAGPLFDRKETLLKQKAITANPKGERVSYFTYDFQVRNRHFSNLEYYVSGVMVSSDLDYLNSQICDFQKAQLHRTLNQTLPSGGEFITYNKKVGYCTFLYNSPYFLFGYLSHAPMVARINNQILPTLTLTPSPTNTPTPKTTKTPTPTKKLTPTRIPLPTKTPTRRPIPTRKPRKPTLTPVEKYHSECRRFLFSKYCVLVKGPGINQCRTSRDCR